MRNERNESKVDDATGQQTETNRQDDKSVEITSLICFRYNTKTRRTQTKFKNSIDIITMTLTMQIPNEYGWVVLGAGVGPFITGVVLSSSVMSARTKFDVKYPNLYAVP
jgi:hypothetical protein